MSYNPNYTGTATVPASQSIKSVEINNSGSTIPQLTPVKITSTGDLGLINVSIESDIQAIAGIADANITNGVGGNVVNGGRILNISTAAFFGSQLYVSKTGGVTASQPDIGADGFQVGDYVVSLGIVAKNASNSSNKDLIVRILLIGQL